MKVRAKINDIKNENREKMNETKSRCFEINNKVVQPLTRQRKKKMQMTKIRNDTGDITTNPADIQEP